MNIVVMDGQGGGLGAQLVSAIIKSIPQARIRAVGTNTTATAAMIKAGASEAATGENATIVACRIADVIVGPIGIVVADAMLGEVTPAMAQAVGQSNARRILIPISQCDNIVVGISGMPASKLLQSAIAHILGQAND